nr:MAG TPA: hypothetical protein [Caudoviricetes sp.]
MNFHNICISFYLLDFSPFEKANIFSNQVLSFICVHRLMGPTICTYL